MSGSFSKFLRTVHDIETEDDTDVVTAADSDLGVELSSVPPLRQAVLLAAEHGASVSEIAEKLQLKPATVRRLIKERVSTAGAEGPITTE